MLYGLIGILVLASAGLALYARAAVQGAVQQYRQVPARSGLCGREVAEFVLRSAQISEVVVERGPEQALSDHYDPRARALRLSPEVHDGRDLAATGIAAHEAGHALQHAAGFGLLRLRSWSVPLARWGSAIGLPVTLVGLGLRSLPLIGLGVGLFAAVVLFQIVTLPVEIDASRRAMHALRRGGLLETEEEEKGVHSVLSSAAMTYVAAAVTGIAGFLQLALRVLPRRL